MCLKYLQVHWEDKVLDWSSLQDRYVMVSGNVQIFRLFRILSKLGPDAFERANLADPQPRANGTTIQFGVENKRWLVYKEIKPWLEFSDKFMVDIDTIQASSGPWASQWLCGRWYVIQWYMVSCSVCPNCCSEEIFLLRCTPLERSWAGNKAFK